VTDVRDANGKGSGNREGRARRSRSTLKSKAFKNSANNLPVLSNHGNRTSVGASVSSNVIESTPRRALIGNEVCYTNKISRLLRRADARQFYGLPFMVEFWDQFAFWA
jgi:hypothetical protein